VSRWAAGLVVVAACGEPAPAPLEVTRVVGPLPRALTAVVVADDGALWVAGADGLVARRAPDDGNLRVMGDAAAETRVWRAMSAAGSGAVVVVGDGGAARWLGPDGSSADWATGTRVTLHGVSADGQGAWVVGGPPATLVRVGPGAEPVAAVLPAEIASDVALRAARAGRDGRVHVVGESGVRLVVADGGVSAARVPGGPRLADVVLDGEAIVAVGGSDVGIALAIEGELTRRLPTGDTPPLTGVVATPRATLAVGLVGTLLERARGGDTWVERAGLEAGFDALDVAVDAAGDVWIVGGRAFDNSLVDGALWRVGRGAEPTIELDAGDADAGADDDAPEVEACPPLGDAEALELGERVSGCWVAYVDGGVARVVNGPQGGSHVELAVRYPGDALAATRVHLVASLVVDGVTAARFELAGLPTEVDGAASGTRITAEVPVIFAGADPSPWLGREATLRVLVDDGSRSLSAERRLTIVR